MTRIERLAALLEDPLLVAGPPYVLGGQANVRYRARWKQRWVRQLTDLIAEELPGCRVRYAF